MKIEAIVKYIVVSFLLFANLSCKENKDETLIAKVTDLTEEEEVISVCLLYTSDAADD